MRISTKGRYGLRAVVDLAVNYAGCPVSIGSIAKRQGFSEIYMEGIFAELRKAGFVKSVKGTQGGYVLADSPSKIKIGAVLRALEGDLLVVDEEDAGNMEDDVRYCLCINVWDKINKAIGKLVDSITLEDLVNEYMKRNGNTAGIYYI